MASRKDRQLKRLRNTIIAFVAVVAVAVIGLGTLYSTGIADGDYEAGTHYQVIDDPQPRRPGEPLLVREYFSYACNACRMFDPLVEDWQDDLPEGVVFDRSHVAFSPVWALLARAHVTLEELDAAEENHDRLFRAIHDEGRQFLSAEMIADFVDGHGVSREAFLRTFDSPAVRRKVAAAERRQRELEIASVPTLVVAGKYRVGMNLGRKTALDVADHLIARETSPGEPPDASAGR